MGAQSRGAERKTFLVAQSGKRLEQNESTRQFLGASFVQYKEDLMSSAYKGSSQRGTPPWAMQSPWRIVATVALAVAALALHSLGAARVLAAPSAACAHETRKREINRGRSGRFR